MCKQKPFENGIAGLAETGNTVLNIKIHTFYTRILLLRPSLENDAKLWGVSPPLFLPPHTFFFFYKLSLTDCLCAKSEWIPHPHSCGCCWQAGSHCYTRSSRILGRSHICACSSVTWGTRLYLWKHTQTCSVDSGSQDSPKD